MDERLVIDPVSRVEGPLRVELGMRGREIQHAYLSGTMVRGFESLMNGRDPRDGWAIAQRICGVCSFAHGLASVRSVEDAWSLKPPPNAGWIRHLMLATQYVLDHVTHFYQLHLADWVDVRAALQADPQAAARLSQSVSSFAKASPSYFGEVQGWLRHEWEARPFGLFGYGWWGHPGYRLSPEAALMLMAHYLEALAWQREVAKIHTVFGGKSPHPHVLVGGVPGAISLGSGGQAKTAVDLVGLDLVKEQIQRIQDFVDQVFLPDCGLLVDFYHLEWMIAGKGERIGNFLSFGEFPDPRGGSGLVMDGLIPSGVILNRDLSRVRPVDPTHPEEIQECIAHAWYRSPHGERGVAVHPWQGESVLEYGGPEPPFRQLSVEKGYSWVKSPRWQGRSVEVGPLARVLMLCAAQHDTTQELVNDFLKRCGFPFEALYSVLGRVVARAVESKVVAEAMDGWYDALLANIRGGDLRTVQSGGWPLLEWPKQGRGVGVVEAPRGALGHWSLIERGVIVNYQVIAPDTWNIGPRDGGGRLGPGEASLVGERLVDPERPLELLRTLHSFDPCMQCASH